MEPSAAGSSSSSFSWERFNRSSFNGRSRNATRDVQKPEEDDLFVFGYSCKLYRDSEKFAWVNSGRHLIPWMGQKQLLIDRYDARGYLNDLSEYDSKLTATKQSGALRDDDDIEFERRLNDERFADLKYEDFDDTTTLTEEAENKVVDDSGQYSKVGYQYDTHAIVKAEDETREDDKDEDTFKVPPGLTIPAHITLPDSNKHHCIIEKTAVFVAQQGSQMEILLKTKQASNSSFNFLSIDSPLNAYYKFLLGEIRLGKYTPKGELSNGQEESDSDADSDNDNYLHPSLLSASKSQCTNNSGKDKLDITNVFTKSQQEDDSYSQLVKHFKDKFAEDIEDTGNSVSEKTPELGNAAEPAAPPAKSVSSLIPQPPADVELIITKLAQHVAKNGDEFESSIKALNDKKFEFLNPGHIYHAFYVKQKIAEIAKQKRAKEPIKSVDASRTIAFSISAKEPPKRISQNVLLARRVGLEQQPLEAKQGAKREESTLSKEQRLQLERKKKVFEFVNLLQKERRIDTHPVTYGPEMPKDDIELSPTIEEVTRSPNHSPKLASHDSVSGRTTARESHEERRLPLGSRSVLPFTTKDELILQRSLSTSPKRRHLSSRSPPRRYRLDRDGSPDEKTTSHHRRRRKSTRKHRHRSRSRSKSRSRSGSKDHHHRHRHSKRSKHRSSRHSSPSLSSSSRSRSLSPHQTRHDDRKHRSRRRESHHHRRSRSDS